MELSPELQRRHANVRAAMIGQCAEHPGLQISIGQASGKLLTSKSELWAQSGLPQTTNTCFRPWLRMLPSGTGLS